MITETGRVVAIESDSLWVETVRRSTCNSCSAQKGCGTGLLNRIGDGRRNHMRVLLDGRDPAQFHLDDDIEISIPEHVLLLGAMVVYLLPLLSMLAGMALLHHYTASEGWAALGALAGFVAGLGLVRLHARRIRDNPHYQPVVAGPAKGTAGVTRVISPDDLAWPG